MLIRYNGRGDAYDCVLTLATFRDLCLAARMHGKGWRVAAMLRGHGLRIGTSTFCWERTR